MGLNQQVYLLHLPQTHSCVPMLVLNQRAGKHNSTRPSDIYVTVAPDQQPCLYNLLAISIHVCYSFIFSAVMSDTLAPTSIHICYSSIQPSVFLLHLQQTSIVVIIVTYAQDEQTCILQLHPTSSQDGNEHLQHTYLLLRVFVLIHCTS